MGKRGEVKIDVERKSMNRDPMIDSDSDRSNLRISMIPAHPDARFLLEAIAFNPPSHDCMDQNLLTSVHTVSVLSSNATA